MTLWRLVIKEIAYRKLNFALAVLAVLVAVGCLVAELTLLRAHEVRAERQSDAQDARTRQRVGRLADDYRVITKQLGYNVLILPAKQDLGRFYAQGYAGETMPEEYARRLSESPLITVQHLLPSLQERIEWPERKFPIILVGTRGEVPQGHRNPKDPIQPLVAPGTMVVGRVVAERLGLEEGKEAVLFGRRLAVAKVHPPRGNEDDVTVWIDLAEAQALLGKPGRLNAILALSCLCAEATPEGIRREITTALDNDVQVLELSAAAATRRAARLRASVHADETVAAQEAGRAELRLVREALAAWIIPLVVIGATVWVGALAFGNVRDRRAEIGILRAIGWRARQILAVLLAKAVAGGLAGGAVGYAAGFALAAAWDVHEAAAGDAAGASALFDPGLLAAAVFLAPILAAAASLVPALLAARQDPAVVLREE
ncbi:MAG: FtsX-like permease family protein [Planctomycetota bacterium]|nr:FtsX-like permease family protein [Planctomycetota bacterium]